MILREDIWRGKSIPEFDREIDHFCFFGDDFSAFCKASEIMSGIAVVALNGNSILFPDSMALLWQNFRESIPVVGVKYTVAKMREFVVKPGKSFGVPFA